MLPTLGGGWAKILIPKSSHSLPDSQCPNMYDAIHSEVLETTWGISQTLVGDGISYTYENF